MIGRVNSPTAEAADTPTTPQWERFPRAPITEALLDIRIEPQGVGVETLAALQDQIKERYPNRKERRSFGGMMPLGPVGSVEMQSEPSGPDGYVFISADQRRMVQARLDGFTFNRLRPYEGWESFRDEARELWDRYRALMGPTSATRVALRYINRIEIPSTATDFREYLLTTPEIAPGLPQGLVHFFMRLAIPMPKFECASILTETVEPLQYDMTPFILDIDVFVEMHLRLDAPEIWETFEMLRACKNTIFFESITPRAKELFR